MVVPCDRVMHRFTLDSEAVRCDDPVLTRVFYDYRYFNTMAFKEPKNIKLGPETNEIWLKQCLNNVLVISPSFLDRF